MHPLIRRDRRIARPADGIEWQAGAGLTAIAFDLQPTQPAVEALPDRRRRLRWPAVAFHLDGPGCGLGAIGLANGFPGFFPRVSRVDFRAHDLAAPDDLS